MTRLFAFSVGLASAAAENVQRLPERLRDVLAAGRSRYEELAERGRAVLDRSGAEPAELPDRPVHPAAGTVPPPGATNRLELPPDVAAEVAAQEPGALLDHDELPLDDFDHLTLPQLRGRIRRLDLVALSQLRDYERAHGDRLPVLTLLENRMAALTGTVDRPS